jgi:hypothetical protein
MIGFSWLRERGWFRAEISQVRRKNKDAPNLGHLTG